MKDTLDERDEAPRTVLVLEDDVLIGDDLATRVRRLGYDVMGPFRSEGAALERLTYRMPTLALLNVGLGAASCRHLMKRLDAANVPFAVLSGYDHGDLPATLRRRPFVPKPFSFNAIERVVGELAVAGALRRNGSARH